MGAVPGSDECHDWWDEADLQFTDSATERRVHWRPPLFPPSVPRRVSKYPRTLAEAPFFVVAPASYRPIGALIQPRPAHRQQLFWRNPPFELAHMGVDDHKALVDQQRAKRKPQVTHLAFLRSCPRSQVPNCNRQSLEGFAALAAQEFLVLVGSPDLLTHSDPLTVGTA